MKSNQITYYRENETRQSNQYSQPRLPSMHSFALFCFALLFSPFLLLVININITCVSKSNRIESILLYLCQSGQKDGMSRDALCVNQILNYTLYMESIQ